MSMPNTSPSASIFVSYSHKDEAAKDELVSHLQVLCGNGIEVWADHDIAAGDDWKPAILGRIERADLAVLLLSADFLNSEFISETELPLMLERRKNGDLRIYPILGKKCAWQIVHWLAEMNLRPGNGEAVWGGNEGSTRAHLAKMSTEIADLIAPPPAEKLSGSGRYFPVETQRRDFSGFLDTVTESWQTDSIARLLGRDTIQQCWRESQSIRNRLNTEFTLAVVGPFKRGKSTLVNALLGREVVTSDVLPETVTVNEIIYGPNNSVEVCLKDGSRAPLRFELLKRELLTESLNRLEGETDHLEISVPVDWLKRMRLVDMPGTGDLLQRFDSLVEQYLVRADAILFVLSPLDPLSASETAFLKLAVQAHDFAKVVFVVNMLDKVKDAEALRIVHHLRQRVEGLFPSAEVFAVSALDEICRLHGKDRPSQERSLSLASGFVALRAHLNESLLSNRELIQLDRAFDETEKLLRKIGQHVELLLATSGQTQQEITRRTLDCENNTSLLYAQMKENCEKFSGIVGAMKSETEGWLSEFFSRLETEAVSLNRFRSEDLRRNFPLFLADSVSAAIHNCLDYHHTVILKELTPVRQDSALAFSFSSESPGSGVRQIRGGATEHAFQASFGSGFWERLDMSKFLSETVDSQIFKIAVDLVHHFEDSAREQQRSMLYQQSVSASMPQLRRLVAERVTKVYEDLETAVIADFEERGRKDRETSLNILRQAGELSGQDNQRLTEELESFRSRIGSAQEALQDLQERLRPDEKESDEYASAFVSARSAATS